jgi:hypothetical protein
LHPPLRNLHPHSLAAIKFCAEMLTISRAKK